MPDYLARVHEPARGVVQHRVSAADAGAVAGVLGVSPMQVLSVRPLPAARGQARLAMQVAWAPPRGSLNLRLFCQELAVLLDAGIALLEALATLHEKEPAASPAAQALQALCTQLQQGRPLADAMLAQPRVFGELLPAVVGASSRSGQLAVALREHGRHLAWAEGLRAKLVGAAIYPALLLLVGLVVTGFLLVVVLPRFAGVLDGLGRDLPWGSQALLSLGVWLDAHPRALLAGLAALAVLPGLAWRSRAFRRGALGLAWRLPGLGPKLQTLSLARCYRTLGMLLAAGVPLVPALALLRGVAGPRWALPLDSLRAQVAAGQRLSDMLDAQGMATPVARRMLRVGERSGELAAMLERAAAFHDEELARLSDFVARAVNPLLMLVLGVVVGGIVVLMYLPIFSLLDGVQ